MSKKKKYKRLSVYSRNVIIIGIWSLKLYRIKKYVCYQWILRFTNVLTSWIYRINDRRVPRGEENSKPISLLLFHKKVHIIIYFSYTVVQLCTHRDLNNIHIYMYTCHSLYICIKIPHFSISCVIVFLSIHWISNSRR